MSTYNTNEFKSAPTSWADMWQADKKNKLGLLALASNSFLLEITAQTFFGGDDVLNSKEGILKALNKLAEVKPNVKLWYRDEGQFQQALQSGEIPMGQYYHDVAGLAAADGHPVRSTFPKEGGVLFKGDKVRQFRDEVLLTNPAGRKFVELYYEYSPPVADVIRKNGFLKAL